MSATGLSDEAINGLGWLLTLIVLGGLLFGCFIQIQIEKLDQRLDALETQQEQK